MKCILSVLVTLAVLMTLLASCAKPPPAEPAPPPTEQVTQAEQVTTTEQETQETTPVSNKPDITAKFTDPAFLSYVRELVGKDDGEPISAEDVADIEKIECSDKSISSLKGIEYFTALTDLECANNQLTTLNLSKNTALEYLDCSGNKLKTLNPRKNTALTDLICYGNQLTKLDVSGNTELTVLDCGDNKLAKLDVSKNTALTELVYDDGVTVTGDAIITNKFTDPNFLSYVRELVGKTGNAPILAGDVTNIKRIVVISKSIHSLNGIEYFTSLKELSCFYNELNTIDLSKNTALTYLDVGDTELKNLDLSNNTALETLYCTGNPLTKLDLSKNTRLTYLRCDENVTVTGYKGNTNWSPPAIFGHY